MLEPQQRVGIGLAEALGGRVELLARYVWLARAPHLPAPVEIDTGLVEALGAVPNDRWMPLQPLSVQMGADALDELLELGLVLGDHAGHRRLRDADQRWRDAGWWTPSAVAHHGGCWEDVDTGDAPRVAVADHGPPPAAVAPRVAIGPAVVLPRAEPTALDGLLQQRRTCRNFDPDGRLALPALARLMHRVFGAQGQVVLAPGAVALKKNSPSGGGLHPVEAFVLALRVDGLPAGGYHYDCVAHALVPVASLPGPADATQALTRAFVAGQAWFAEAPVLVVLVARFARCQWKYRNHPKAHRVVLLDAGHLGQTLALAATEQGLGSFITAAINETAIEPFLGLASGEEGAVAICGFGARLDAGERAELTAAGLTARP